MRRLVIVLFAAMAALSGQAAAAPPDKEALRAAGLHVTWPVEGSRARVFTGQVVVRVGATRARMRSGRRVRVRLVRLGASGRPLEAIATRVMRRGVFRARLVRPSTRYRLTLEADGRRYGSVLVTAVNQQTAGFPGCRAEGASAAVLRVDRTTVRRGERVNATFQNIGPTCLFGGVDWSWEQLRGGTWQAVPSAQPFPTVGVIFRPGKVENFAADVIAALEPGRARLVKRVAGPDGDRIATAELDVLP
jgi:hypothetical protein